MNAPPGITRSRLQVNRLVSAPVVAVGSFAFMTAIPFLPGAPVFPLLVAIGLGFLSIRSPGWVSGTLLVISFFSITWQLLGFGLLNLFSTTGGSALALALFAVLLINPVSAREDPAALALTFLAVALMLTPYYYLSIGLVVFATAIAGSASLVRISVTFVETLTPLLIVENALYLGQPGRAGRTPVVFAQLTNIAQNLRPALPGLNLYLTGIPQNFVSQYADSVNQFLGSGAVTSLIVPILLLGVATTSTVLVSGILTSRLAFLEKVSQVKGIRVAFSPMIGSTVAPVPFIFLITVFSLPTIGGYQEGLAAYNSLFIVLGSFTFSVFIVVREAFVWRFERAELARDQIHELSERVRKMTDEGLGIIRRVVASAPSVSVSKEENEINVDSAYVRDILKGVGTANYASLTRWLTDIQRRLLPSTESLTEVLKSKVVNELERTSALARGYNNLLSEAGISPSFSNVNSSYAGLDVEPAIGEYDRMISAVRSESMQLYENYIATIGSFNHLIDHAVGLPPVNPGSLFDSHDYSGAMRLVVEEYWISFHLTYQQELQSRLASLRVAMEGLRGTLDPTAQEHLDAILPGLLNVKPSSATELLHAMEKIKAVLTSAIDHEITKVEDARRLVRSISPSGEKIAGIDFDSELEALRPLQAAGRTTEPSFDGLMELIASARSTLATVRGQEAKDEEKLTVIAQYPVARRLLDRLTTQNRELAITDLPFQREASLLFMKLYASGNKDAKFDPTNEVLVTRNAKVR